MIGDVIIFMTGFACGLLVLLWRDCVRADRERQP
jgi:hypothetical protein